MPTHLPRAPRHALLSRRLATLPTGVPTALACVLAAVVPIPGTPGPLLGVLAPRLGGVAGFGTYDGRASAQPAPRLIRHGRAHHARPRGMPAVATIARRAVAATRGARAIRVAPPHPPRAAPRTRRPAQPPRRRSAPPRAPRRADAVATPAPPASEPAPAPAEAAATPAPTPAAPAPATTPVPVEAAEPPERREPVEPEHREPPEREHRSPAPRTMSADPRAG